MKIVVYAFCFSSFSSSHPCLYFFYLFCVLYGCAPCRYHHYNCVSSAFCVGPPSQILIGI